MTHVLDRCSLGQFACKRVPVGNDHNWLEKVLIEVQTLQHLSHANLVSYKHVWLEDYKINKFGPSVPCAFILQQYQQRGRLASLRSPNCARYTANIRSTQRPVMAALKAASRPADPPGPRRIPFDDIFSFSAT